MIKLSDIHITHGDRLVLGIPNLTFETGGRYAVIGANGAGKTTLLRLIAGTMQPQGGAVLVPQEFSRDRGYMPQHPYIFSFSVLRNVTMALERCAQSQQIALQALNAVGMAAFHKAKGRSLSGGEAQRVAIARIIAIPRKLIILDEPTSSTDIAGNNLVEAALLDYCRTTGCTMIFSTHSPAQAMRLATRVLMLDNGTLVENGTPEQVLRQPQSPQGRSFLQHWELQGY